MQSPVSPTPPSPSPPSPSNFSTSLTVQTSDGAKFPAPPSNATLWPVNTQPLGTSAEIARVTNTIGSVLTISRSREESSAQAVKIGWQIAETWTAKDITGMQKQEGLTRPVALMGAQGFHSRI